MSASLFAVLGLGPMELAIVGVVILLLFGSRLPSVARSIGQSFKAFQRGYNEPLEDAKPGEAS
jgi:sec-independent protein translocase protein TatA